MAAVEMNEQMFKEAVEGEGITLVDFWAEWCGPCKMFGPIFEKVSERHEDVKFGKINTETEQAVAAALQINSIPTLMVFRDGVMLFNQAGALPEAALEDIIKQAKSLDMDKVRAEIEAEESKAGA